MIPVSIVCRRPCPSCGGRGPHALVSGTKRFRWGPFVLCVLFSCGLGVVLAPWFYAARTQAWCRRCRLEFNP